MRTLSRFPVLTVGVLASLGAYVFLSWQLAHRAPPTLPPAAWVVDFAQGAGPSGKLPQKPLEGQKRPPCSGWQVRINGGCWLKLSTPEGETGGVCPSGYFSHENSCYVPVLQGPVTPTVIHP